MQANILVVEDDQDISSLISLNLSILGFDITCCADGLEALKLANENNYNLIILDIMLPSLDGLSICKKLRSNKNFTPILMLTAKNSEANRVMGLEVGADDYLTKPFGVLELQARVKALLRRVEFMSKNEDDVDNKKLQSGKLCIDVTRRVVSLDEKEITITAKEFDLLHYLASSPGRVYSREQLLDAVWGYQHAGYEHTVNSHINRLRSKIESDPAHPDYVLTVWGVGYKFNGNL